jgi:hypothetical protein
VLLQEAVDWDKYGHKQLGRAMDDLDMDAMPIPPSSSGYPPTLHYRRETIGRWRFWNTDFAQQRLSMSFNSSWRSSCSQMFTGNDGAGVSEAFAPITGMTGTSGEAGTVISGHARDLGGALLRRTG